MHSEPDSWLLELGCGALLPACVTLSAWRYVFLGSSLFEVPGFDTILSPNSLQSNLTLKAPTFASLHDKNVCAC